ncbi:MAG: exosome complex RNA-binding protein Csl4, partial [archaeon]
LKPFPSKKLYTRKLFFSDLMKKKEDLVLPGDFLTTGEEFVSGANTFEDDEGQILASVVGCKEFDETEKEARVKKKSRELILPAKHSIVLGRVHLVKDNMVLLEVCAVFSQNQPVPTSNSFGVLLIRNASRDFVKNFEDLYRIGDIVKARVTGISPDGLELSTNESSLGVIQGYCISCRHTLQLFNHDLKCNNCGLTQKRKLSSEYLLK